MPQLIVQIYEIQTPSEAEAMIQLGVDHIGSVLLSERTWKVQSIKETTNLIHSTAAKSSLIPLFSDTDAILRSLDFYRPDIVHFCEDINGRGENDFLHENLIITQERVKSCFPEILIMRSIPVVQSGTNSVVSTLEPARMFEAVTDFFLADTVIVTETNASSGRQPVSGFVGVTGHICNWDIASKLVAQSRIPVILGGGISADNVFEGIRQVRPAGVDSCTKTNALDLKGRPVRFQKDQQRVEHLINEVRRAESEIDG